MPFLFPRDAEHVICQRQIAASSRLRAKKTGQVMSIRLVHVNRVPHQIDRFLSEVALACGVHFRQECFGGCMAKIIEFYIPQSFRKVSKWLPPNERGKVLEFPMAV